MKPTDLDDTDPPAADGQRLTDVYARGRTVGRHRARVRSARYTAGFVAVAVVAVAGGLAWVRHDRTPRRVVASPSTTTTVHSAPTAASIAGLWQAESITGYRGPLTSPPLSSTPDLNFLDASKWGASDGCNGLGGAYRLGAGGAFQLVGGTASTLMLCSLVVPTNAVLTSTARIELAGAKLVLRDARGHVLATYARPSPWALIGEWQPTSISSHSGPLTSPPLPRAPVLRFVSGAEWDGSDGCNGASGSYRIASDGAFRVVGTPVSTKMLCSTGVPTIAILAATARIEPRGDQLRLFDGNGALIATYERVKSPITTIVGTWRPVAITGYTGPLASPPLPAAPLLHFESTPSARPSWSGSDGCNDASGAYQVSPDGAFAVVGAGVQTQKGCIPDPAVVPTATVVTSTKRVEISGATLTMFDGKNNVLATYARVP